ncbi:hypothetical protein [Streptomyces sp. NBC_01435]|uniref:hypothetical protein n=1 Tax=Streptomyces sp. NBC_01435 TaxID=2903865 RepID=UPI002E325A09|nr:hypothetical protein [Streptomyces sp. NBC_01435]
MNNRIVIDLDRDGWTKNLQLNIANLDENDRGMGFRLAGPKYNGSSTNLLRTELDERDAAEIRAMLDAVFPASTPAPITEAYPGELPILRGLVGVLRVVAQHGDMAEVQRLLTEHAADEQAAYIEAPTL